MSRLEKKCLMASAGTHGILLLLVVFGTAFFVPNPKRPIDIPAMKVVPTKLIDEALAGGGGNPKLAPSDAKEQGNTLRPQPPRPPPPERRKTPPRKPDPPPPSKKPEVQRATPPPKKMDPPPPIVLKPVVRTTKEKEDTRAQAEARRLADANRKIMDQAVKELRAGFEQGTVVEASGPGGQAYMNYAAWVKQVYEEAWLVTEDLTDENSTVRAVVTIARDGRVISAYIDRRSGNAALDRSVQRALDRVKTIGQSFPAGAREDTRTFTINFNLKAKRLTG